MGPSDHQAYFVALAQQYVQRAEHETMPARSAYLAGKYFARAGELAQAEEWLKRAKRVVGWTEMTAAEQARAWMYLGLTREQASNFAAAEVAYQTAVSLSPTLVEPKAKLLSLLRQLGYLSAAEEVGASMATLGPTYRLGTFGAGYAMPKPVMLPNGWTLIGYDVDEESLEAGSLMELWLWWQGPAGEEPEAGEWLPVGDYWLQRQVVVNLAPNPGFEWGAATNGLPMGFLHMWAPEDVSTPVIGAEGPIGPTHLLRLHRYPGMVAIQSAPIPIDPRSLYLAGSWGRWSGGISFNRGAISLRCSEASGFGFGISSPQPDAAKQTWFHMTYFGPPKPDRSTNLCTIAFLAGYGWAEWDQVMIVRLSSTP
jgi:hypothetical protein